MSRRRTIAPIALVGTLTLAACTGDDDATPAETTAAESTADAEDGAAAAEGPADEPSDDAEATTVDGDLGSAMWLFADAAFETNDFWRGADADGRLRNWQLFPGAPLVAIADSADGHVALVSDDLTSFRPVHRGCCGFTHADRIGDRIVIVAASPDGSTAFASPDAGVNWTTHEIVLPGGSVDDPFVPSGVALVGDGYLVTGEPTRGGQSPGVVWRSDDLVTWTPIALPGIDPALPNGSSVSLARGGTGESWVIASVALDGGLDAVTAPYRALDDARTVEPLAQFTGSRGTVAPVGDRLALWPIVADDGSHPWILVPGDGWARAPADDAQWGDAGLDVRAVATDPATGRAVAAVERRIADQSICPDGNIPCDLTETALVTSADGLSWRDVEPGAWERPPDFTVATIVPTLAPLGDDGWAIWQPDATSGDVVVHRWTGPAAITTADPLPLYRGGPIAIGRSVRFRFAYPTWNCNTDITVDDVAWVFEPTLPQDPPPTWPVTFPTVVEPDGPSVYYDGRLDRVDEGRMLFSMPGVDETFVATPGEPC